MCFDYTWKSKVFFFLFGASICVEVKKPRASASGDIFIEINWFNDVI